MTELLQRLETARAEKRHSIITSLRDRLHAVRPTPTAVVLFGSIARGDFDGRSDIDLVVIEEASGVHEALVDIARPIDLVPIPVTNWQRRLADSDRFVTGVRQEGVLLAGTWPDGLMMTDKDTDFGDQLIASMGEALAHARGEATGVRETQIEVPTPEARAIRNKIGLSQKRFAPLLGVSVSGLQKWEQGKRRPMGAAATLLHVMDEDPATFARALGTAKTDKQADIKQTKKC